jgi:hypothetical protein
LAWITATSEVGAIDMDYSTGIIHDVFWLDKWFAVSRSYLLYASTFSTNGPGTNRQNFPLTWLKKYKNRLNIPCLKRVDPGPGTANTWFHPCQMRPLVAKWKKLLQWEYCVPLTSSAHAWRC